jgi:hypothetical protein
MRSPCYARKNFYENIPADEVKYRAKIAKKRNEKISSE